MSLALLVAAPLALHLALRRGPCDEGRRLPWWGEAALVVACGVAGAWMQAWPRWEDFVTAGVYTSSDFTEYCSTVAQLRDGAWPEHSQRSLLAGLPSAWLGSEGVLEGMARAALASTALFHAGLYLWGRALHGPVAGIAAVLFAGALAPLALLSHDLSFYPEIVAVFTCAGAAAAAALRWRGWKTQLVLGVAVAACLLVDVKGLAWALAFGGLGLLAALSAGRRAPLLLLALLLPVGASYPLGRVANPVYAISLEDQADMRARHQEFGLVFDDSYVRWDTDFLWGRSDPLEIPKTLHTVWALGKGVHPDYVSADQGTRRWATTMAGVAPAAGLLWASGLVLLAVRRRDPWFVLALLGTAVPFAVAIESAVRMHQSFPRHLAVGLPFALVWSGVAWSGLLDGFRDRVGVRLDPRALLGLLLLGAVLTGRVATELSPDAAWREPIAAEGGDIRRMLEVSSPGANPREHACFQGMQQDRARGLRVRGQLYGGEPLEP